MENEEKKVKKEKKRRPKYQGMIFEALEAADTDAVVVPTLDENGAKTTTVVFSQTYSTGFKPFVVINVEPNEKVIVYNKLTGTHCVKNKNGKGGYVVVWGLCNYIVVKTKKLNLNYPPFKVSTNTVDGQHVAIDLVIGAEITAPYQARYKNDDIFGYIQYKVQTLMVQFASHRTYDEIRDFDVQNMGREIQKLQNRLPVAQAELAQNNARLNSLITSGNATQELVDFYEQKCEELKAEIELIPEKILDVQSINSVLSSINAVNKKTTFGVAVEIIAKQAVKQSEAMETARENQAVAAADAKVTKTRADADAYATRVRAEAEAEREEKLNAARFRAVVGVLKESGLVIDGSSLQPIVQALAATQLANGGTSNTVFFDMGNGLNNNAQAAKTAQLVNAYKPRNNNGGSSTSE